MQGLYKILCEANGMTYIGSSINVERRLRLHVNALRRGDHDNPRLQHAWNKHGAAAFTFFPWIGVLQREDVGRMEQEALDVLFAAGDCFNMNRSVDQPNLGRTHSAEARAKISAARKGSKLSAASRAQRAVYMAGFPNPMQGRRHSAETLAKISAALKDGFATGRPASINPPNAARRAQEAERMRATPLRKDKGKPLRGVKGEEVREWLTTIACAKDLGCDLSYPSQRVDTGRTVKGWTLTYV